MKKVVLYAILNWGLGHASRSIPVIQYLQKMGFSVVVCSDGIVLDFLKSELNDVIIESLPSYNINYKYNSMSLNMFVQGPKLVRTYFKERRIFSGLEKKYKASYIISDNRYGCYSSEIPSYFIGHQWNILKSTNKVHKLGSWMNQLLIKKFDQLLIPDNEEINLTGLMSRSTKSMQTRWIGFLSRFENYNHSDKEKQYDFLAILSGPEPRRNQLEERIIKLSQLLPEKKFVLIRGTNSEFAFSYKNLITINLAGSESIHKFVSSSKLLLCRSGYSSVMDYMILGNKPIVFVPTSGQYEQIALSKKLEQIGGYYTLNEQEWSDSFLIKLITNPPLTPVKNYAHAEEYKSVIKSLMQVK